MPLFSMIALTAGVAKASIKYLPFVIRQKRPLSLRTEGVNTRTTSGSPPPRGEGLIGCQHTLTL